MYRLLQKYNKKLLAIFAVFLMIVFILPSTFQGFGNPGDVVVGRIGGEDGEEVRATALQNARYEWEALSRPLPGMGFSLAMAVIGPDVAAAISQNPELYLLLQEEARRMGVQVNQDRLNAMVTNELPPFLPPDRDEAEAVKQGIANLMLIQSAFARAASTIKISEPMRRQMVGEAMQSIGVRLVEFDAKDFAEQAPPPTTQQVQEQFAAYAGVTPAPDTAAPQEQPTTAPTTNPFGFGYKYPDRVKLQYVAVPRDVVRKSVEASRSDYEWKVAAQKYYLQNPHQFQTTPPTTAPATRPTGVPFTLDEPATQATQASTQPTTKPFADVQDEIKNRLVVPEVDQKLTQIAARVTAYMNADHAAYVAAAGGTTRPTTVPASSLGVPYDDFSYLQKLAEAIQKEFGVLPTIVSLEDQWRSADDLRQLSGIAYATGPSSMDFSTYATTQAEAFIPADRRQEPNVLSPYEPSKALRDFLGNVYIFRLTAAEPSHAPAGPDEVAEAVRKDVVAKQTYEQAKAAATQLLDAARQGGLEPAATGAGKSVISTGLFRRRGVEDIAGYPLTGAAADRFREQAFELLSQPQASPDATTKPTVLIELPREGKILVAELGDVKAEWQPESAHVLQQEALAALNQQELQAFAQDWYDYDNVVARLNYQPTEAADRPSRGGDAPAPPRPRPPMF